MIPGFDILLGHLVGDYLLQNNWMALNKKLHTLQGELACNVHCILYTVAVCSFTSWEFLWVFCVYASHYILDRTNIIDWYQRLIGSRSLSKFIVETEEYSQLRLLQGGFAAAVYIANDNTAHLLLMYTLWKYVH